jgi:hypothetical protein
MSKRIFYCLFLSIFSLDYFSQPNVQDTVYLLNGSVIGQKVLDTILGAITIADPDKPEKKIHFEFDQLYMVRFSDGYKRYYYEQDTSIYNWFTREEMWMYMKGETDAHKGFKARGALIGSAVTGLLGGLTGNFFAPLLPFTFMALSGITKVKIRQETISNPIYVESDPYILGYERVARQKRKIRSIIGGTIGLLVGYGFYTAFHQYYPQKIDFGFKR